jgi:hypothetical protein
MSDELDAVLAEALAAVARAAFREMCGHLPESERPGEDDDFAYLTGDVADGEYFDLGQVRYSLARRQRVARAPRARWCRNHRVSQRRLPGAHRRARNPEWASMLN